MELPVKRMAQVTRDLVLAGWRVEAEGKLIRPASEFKLAVTTGIDWFELGGQVDFGGQEVALPDLLDAARRGETMVTPGRRLDGDAPRGLAQEVRHARRPGHRGERPASASAAPRPACSTRCWRPSPRSRSMPRFTKVRESLHRFEGVKPLEAPAGFHGELRPYQCEGLGWLDYLQQFDFGGILADDMGLGKTIQVLALLQRRRSRRQAKGPSLGVVPRSLVFNWIAGGQPSSPRGSACSTTPARTGTPSARSSTTTT